MRTEQPLCKHCHHPIQHHYTVTTPSRRHLQACEPECNCKKPANKNKKYTTNEIDLNKPTKCFYCGRTAITLYLSEDGKRYIAGDCLKCRKHDYTCRHNGCKEKATHIRITKKKNLRPLCTQHTLDVIK